VCITPEHARRLYVRLKEVCVFFWFFTFYILLRGGTLASFLCTELFGPACMVAYSQDVWSHPPTATPSASRLELDVTCVDRGVPRAVRAGVDTPGDMCVQAETAWVSLNNSIRWPQGRRGTRAPDSQARHR